ncbi:Transmembrane transcriptional regulator (anti-sigma factor RsiW) [Paraburkholderia fungorum]|uniref:Transmembrane transcriptional regulator (Anti-sigma factor RsiW) n=1 Tax=Paraburkholderia fungorum TaxID=134537 RepID=A0A1H1BCS7_9BURK|nr:anti-sigma factor [Paraburkholderia fungorum]SDQ49166.1 Transmembrane transcriptional regulator (anti-sigma factor RsiW) [Paraburkholderia fungorum]
MNNDDYDHSLPEGLDLRALSAFVDGELPEAQRVEVEAKLAQHPQAAAKVAAWRAQKAALRALCGISPRGDRGARAYGVVNDDDPEEARDRNDGNDGSDRINRDEEHADSRHVYANANPAPRIDADEPAFIVIRRPVPWWQRVGVAACWLAAGAGLALAVGPLAPRLTGGAWRGLGGQPPGFAQRADIAYAVYSPERRHPVEVAASDEEHLINWLSKRLNRPLSVPSLQEYGYSLVGGRLLPGEAGPAAQFMYENHEGARLTLYVTGIARDETEFRLFRDGNRRTFYWISDGMGYALSGAIAEGKLRSMAIDVCSALGGKPEAWQ